MENLTIIVNSCDSYEDLWYPFFELFRINWPDCKYPIVLNTESKIYSHPNPVGGGITCFQLFDGKNVPWSKRLIKTLKRIESDLVLFMLDDFFIQNPVAFDKFEQCVRWMEMNPNIGYFCFYPTTGPNIVSHEYVGFEKRTVKAPFLCHCQAAIWKKQCLLEILRAKETPWEFEENGSKRAKYLNYDFYSYCRDEKTPEREWKLIIPYILAVTLGYGVWHGKWLFCNKELFERYGIEADFSHRGQWKSREEVLEYINTPRQDNNYSIPKRIFGKIR